MWQNGVMNTAKRYSSEVRERAVRMVLEHEEKDGSQLATCFGLATGGRSPPDPPARGTRPRDRARPIPRVTSRARERCLPLRFTCCASKRPGQPK